MQTYIIYLLVIYVIKRNSFNYITAKDIII